MKLVYAIVRNDNEDDVVSLLNQNHYSVTRLSTTGGFLKKGNTTLMIGVEDEKVEEVITLIKQDADSTETDCEHAIYFRTCYGKLCYHAYDCRGRRSYYLCDQCRSLRKDLTPGIFGKHVCILSKITKSMKKMQNFVKFSLFPLGATYIIMLYAST